MNIISLKGSAVFCCLFSPVRNVTLLRGKPNPVCVCDTLAGRKHTVQCSTDSANTSHHSPALFTVLLHRILTPEISGDAQQQLSLSKQVFLLVQTVDRLTDALGCSRHSE